MMVLYQLAANRPPLLSPRVQDLVPALVAAGLMAESKTGMSHGDRADDSFPGFREAPAALGATAALEPVRI